VAVIDSTEMLRRLRSLVPHGWFGDVAPIRDIVLGGVADAMVWVRAQGQVVRAGTRRAGTTGWLLDVDPYGFFGTTFLRHPGESDDAWRKRYTDEIFRPRVTRPAIDKALFDLTGRHPIILELWNTGDCGGYGVPSTAYGGGVPNAAWSGGYGSGQGGYGSGQGYEGYAITPTNASVSPGAGRYGSIAYPYQVFVTAFRPMTAGIPLIGGYGTTNAGYGAGALEYADMSQVGSTVADADIYACINRTDGAGVTAWVAIQN